MLILGISHTHLQQGGTHAAYHIVCKESLRSKLILQLSSKHPQRKHIEEQMRHSAVQEHICKELIAMEHRALHVKQRKARQQLVANGQERCCQQRHAVGYDKILHHRRGDILSVCVHISRFSAPRRIRI